MFIDSVQASGYSEMEGISQKTISKTASSRIPRPRWSSNRKPSIRNKYKESFTNLTKLQILENRDSTCINIRDSIGDSKQISKSKLKMESRILKESEMRREGGRRRNDHYIESKYYIVNRI